MIYIDPPYNTGKDFIYKDNFTADKTEYMEDSGQIDADGGKLVANPDSNGRYHSDWLSMMYPRLKLARNLLRDDGVIFISIGEEEIENLKTLCDTIFGEQNFRNSFILRRYDKNINRQFMDEGLKSFNTGFEYILCYARSSGFSFSPIYKEASDKRKTSGYWKGFWNDADRPTMRYDVLGFEPTTGQWKWSKAKALEGVENYKTYIEEFSDTISIEKYWKQNGEKLKFIRRNLNGKGKNLGVEHWIPPSQGILRNTNWLDILASKSTDAVKGLFDFPKNPEAIQVMLQSQFGKDTVVLDFFAGSGTTAEAILQLNAQDGGSRKCISVQLPEAVDEKSEVFNAGYSTIAEISKERIRRAGAKILEDNPDQVGKLDIGFRVLKIDSSNMNDVYYAPGDVKGGVKSGHVAA
ncbi:MAG: site-specific DNA-methyltransferase [Robiginitomaculum sp.]|nr:site-specific DNA-methyltransferase [Robiginitomaculum sp.]